MSLFTAGNTPTQGEEGASVRGDLPDSDPAEEEEEAAWWGRAFHIQLLAARLLDLCSKDHLCLVFLQS
ncbi:hypothetical protein Y1Q_0005617 [Alligator mississippiensis]|uniref:Uncharacterized protein n=1 Tax=Alligator mississippiensis TaxID=8496 RepID=A0A151MFL5_ALLMI|nr:hypothetical protein Y1Q_0005617 [Alligator mississippiensis]